MTSIETKLLQQIYNNTKQLERIAKRLDIISKQLERIDHKDDFISQEINHISQAIDNKNFISDGCMTPSQEESYNEMLNRAKHQVLENILDEEVCDRPQMDCENCWKKLHCRVKETSQINCIWEVEDGL